MCIKYVLSKPSENVIIYLVRAIISNKHKTLEEEYTIP
jgi:hypothetical protein